MTLVPYVELEPEPQRRRVCEASCKSGRPCAAPALPSVAYCLMHDPSRAVQLREARVLGGHNSARAARLQRLGPPALAPVYELLAQALVEVHDGTLDPRQGAAMAAIASAMVKVLTAGEMEARLRELEERL